MDRRTFMAGTVIAISSTVSGCGSALTPGNNGTPERPWSPSEPIDDPDGVHHLYISNHTDTTETAWVRVVREDGATLVEGRFDLPDMRGIKFEAIADWETTYTIDLAIDGDDRTTLEWQTTSCGPDSEAPGDGGSRNANVRVEAASDDDQKRVSLVVDQCDALHAPSVPTGSAEAFRVDA